MRRLFVSTIEELETRQLFQEYFGYWCVDSDFVPGKIGSAINERLILRIGHEDVWPVTPDRVGHWDNDKVPRLLDASTANASMSFCASIHADT